MSKLPIPAQLWFILTAPVVLIGAIFVLTRAPSANVPHPLAETVPFNYCVLYATYDRRYSSNDDVFIVVQSWLNVVEVCLGLSAVAFAWSGRRDDSVRLALVVSVMSVYRTVVYMTMEVFEGGKYTKHNAPMDTVLMVVMPSSFWTLVSGMIALHCMGQLSVNAKINIKAKSS